MACKLYILFATRCISYRKTCSLLKSMTSAMKFSYEIAPATTIYHLQQSLLSAANLLSAAERSVGWIKPMQSQADALNHCHLANSFSIMYYWKRTRFILNLLAYQLETGSTASCQSITNVIVQLDDGTGKTWCINNIRSILTVCYADRLQ